VTENKRGWLEPRLRKRAEESLLELALYFRDIGQDDKDDAILEFLDQLTGFCSEQNTI
jgi:hypothetical protein